MKKIVMFSLIISLFIFCCNNVDKEEEKNDTIVETERVIVNVDTSSIIKSNEKKVFNFNEFNYDVCYVKDGGLYFYSSKDGVSSQFPDSSQIEHAVISTNKEVLYYTALKDGNLWLKKTFLSDLKNETNWLINLNRPPNKFKTETYNEKGKFIFYNDSLFLECEYAWMEGFYKMCVYDIKKNKLTTPENFIYNLKTRINTAKGNPSEFAPSNINSRKIGDTYELFFKRNNDSVQISYTKDFDKEILADSDEENPTMNAYTKSFRFSISPDSSKLYYSLVTGMGDLAHGPIFIVNIDGTEQIQLNSDGISSEFKPVWLHKNSVIFLREGDEASKTPAGLYITGAIKNGITLIDTLVSYYQVL